MSRKQAKSRPKSGLTDDERKGSRAAARLGLYVLFEGSPAFRTWRVYDRRTGAVVGWWTPHNHRFGVNGTTGTDADFRSVLERARPAA